MRYPTAPPNMINRTGLEINGMSDQIRRAINSGMIKLRLLTFADLAEVNTGATINATTAGRMPMNMLVRVWFCLIVSGVRNIAMARIMRNEGSMVPKAAIMQPFSLDDL